MSKQNVPASSRWASFPAFASPRPIVLLDERVHLPAGFIDDASKVAWLRGAIVSDVTLPPGVLDLMMQPGPVASADTPLRVTSLERTTAPFLCDRGPRELPAYKITATGLREPCLVLDPDVECWWPKGDEARSPVGRQATIDADERTIHFPAFGGVLTEFHRAEFEEHDTYVVGNAITSRRSAAAGTAIPAILINAQVIGVLQRPLGARVLINREDEPLAVTSDPLHS